LRFKLKRLLETGLYEVLRAGSTVQGCCHYILKMKEDFKALYFFPVPEFLLIFGS